MSFNPWEENSCIAMKEALASAEWDTNNRSVTLRPTSLDRVTCKTIDSLRSQLEDIAIAGSSMPHDGGDAAFEIDYDSLVNGVLRQYNKEISKLKWTIN